MKKTGSVRCRPIITMSFCLFFNGCTGLGCCLTLPISGNNSFHYVVIGLGIVSVPKPNAQTAILATKAQTLGFIVSDQPSPKVGFGYTSDSVVAIPDGAEDVRVEISQMPAGVITITSPSATLK